VFLLGHSNQTIHLLLLQQDENLEIGLNAMVKNIKGELD